MVDYLYARIGGGIVVANLATAVLAAVVYQHNLPVRKGLPHDTIDAPTQGALGIVDGHYYGYGRVGWRGGARSHSVV